MPDITDGSRLRSWIRGLVRLSEHERVGIRRRDARRKQRAEAGWDEPAGAGEPLVGICCSGGGIRSAAFNLGALQTLQSEGKLSQARYLSAVSGGAYIAAAFSIVQKEHQDDVPEESEDEYPERRWLARRRQLAAGSIRQRWRAWRRGRLGAAERRGGWPTASDRSTFRKTPPYARRSPEERYLRSHSSYLASGFRGKLSLLSYILFGSLLTVVVVAALIAIVGVPAALLGRQFTPELGPVDTAWFSRYANAVRWASGGLLGSAVLLGLIAVGTRLGDDPDKAAQRWSARLARWGLAIFILCFALPWLVLTLRSVTSSVPLTGASGDTALSQVLAVLGAAGIPTVLLAVVRLVAHELKSVEPSERRKWLARVPGWTSVVAWLVTPTIVTAAFLLIYHWASGWPLLTAAAWYVAFVAVLAAVWFLCDPTSSSLHTFYKRRLASAFAVQRVTLRGDEKEEKAVERPYRRLAKLSDSRVAAPGEWPQLLVCAAANVSDQGATPTGRNAVPFVFSDDWVGGEEIGWLRTRSFERAMGTVRRRDTTLMAAVAMSGAALSPSMGSQTRSPYRFLLGLANARLGVWLPNPRYIHDVEDPDEPVLDRPAVPARHRPRMSWLVRELLGWNSIHAKYIYVTDGGHFENLGLLELLRRKCTEIYCFDASGDKPETFTTIAQTLALARTELDVDIPLDPLGLRWEQPNENGPPRPLAKKSHMCVPFAYPAEDGKPARKGKLVYVKCRVTEDTPWDLRSLYERDKAFPDHSTADQLYGEERFEAYRALGEHLACDALAEMAGDGPATDDVSPTGTAPPSATEVQHGTPPPGNGQSPDATITWWRKAGQWVQAHR